MWTVKLSEKADEEYQFWAKHNSVILKKINKLIDNICEDPNVLPTLHELIISYSVFYGEVLNLSTGEFDTNVVNSK